MVVTWENVRDSPGWLDMRIGTGDPLMAGVPDPYPEMVDWVLRCCTEWTPQTFHWDSDGMSVLFTFVSIPSFLRVDDLTSQGLPELVWLGTVSKLQLHEAFYQGFMAFVESREFEAWRWCEFSLREWIDRSSHGRTQQMVDDWTGRSRAEVETHLYEIDDGVNYGDELAFPEIAKILPPGRKIGSRPWIRRELQLPDSWDSASEQERRGILDEILALDVGYDQKENPRTLRSEPLDRWYRDEISKRDAVDDRG